MDAVLPLAPDPAPHPSEPTYYDRPALKPSPYGFTVALYLFVGGLAGAAQILATAADLLTVPGSAGVILAGRLLALAGAIVGAILLIIDLHTKHRFYNMVRIFRATSPMSIGTYVLLGFGFFSLLALAAQLLGLHAAARACGILAALAGIGMTTYTAALLATSTPLWAAVPRLLAVRFASSAIATGAAALCLVALWSPRGAELARAFGNIAALALAVDLVASVVALQAYRAAGGASPLRDSPWCPLHLFGMQLAGRALPIVLYLLADRVGAPAILLPIASLCALAGDLLMRGVVLSAGNESARRPRDYFRFARLSQETAT